jgi:predicted amidohydrolase YtcJ
MRQGLTVAFSSDRPVTHGHPLAGIQAAVERRTAAGVVLGQDHRVSVQDALRYYTAGGAYATFCEPWKGCLSPGRRADFVALDRDITACPADEITQARVLLTVIDGEVVFDGRG